MENKPCTECQCQTKSSAPSALFFTLPATIRQMVETLLAAGKGLFQLNGVSIHDFATTVSLLAPAGPREAQTVISLRFRGIREMTETDQGQSHSVALPYSRNSLISSMKNAGIDDNFLVPDSCDALAHLIESLGYVYNGGSNSISYIERKGYAVSHNHIGFIRNVRESNSRQLYEVYVSISYITGCRPVEQAVYNFEPIGPTGFGC